MAIDPVISAGGGSASASATAGAKLSADYTSFLKLLTAQISNQDPLEPMDSTTFVSQLAQLSQVEQSIVTNTNLEQISAELAATGALADMQLIGRDVTLASDTIELKDGHASFDYQLAEEAERVTVKILASDGAVVREFEGLSGLAGGEVHTVAWDGLDDDGMPVPDAVFTVEVEAMTGEDEIVSASTYSIARVEELSFDTGQPLLKLSNGATALPGAVISIR